MNTQYDKSQTDEIDLRTLLLNLIAGWRWIIGGVAAALALSVAYLALTPNSYKTELRFEEFAGVLQVLNGTPGINYSSNKLLQELVSKLGSYDNFNRFLEESDTHRQRLADIYRDEQADGEARDRIRQFFFDQFSVNPPDEGASNASVSLKLTYGETHQGPELLNDYYRWTGKHLINQLVARADRAVANVIRRNERRMQAYLGNYSDELDNRIERLQEQDKVRRLTLQDKLEAEHAAERDARRERTRALKQAQEIAASLGIQKPTTPSAMGRQQDGERDTVYAEINSQGLPLYFMGTEALASERKVIEQNLEENVKTAAILNIEKELKELENNREIEVLKARKNAEAFVEEFNKLREENALLRSNQVSAEDIQVSEIVHLAYDPSRPDSPRRVLTLILAFMLGGMVGVMGLGLARVLRPDLSNSREPPSSREV